MDLKYSRIESLVKDDFTKLQNAKVLIIGVGGVGSFCLDCLYRSGVTQITIIDGDVYDETNVNRQLHSECHIGEVKVDALKTHYKNIKTLHMRVDESWVNESDLSEFDTIIDACDDTKVKLALALKYHKKLICSMGSANRLDATKIKVDTIFNTYGDKLASKIRYELRKRKFSKKYQCVFSSEEPLNKNRGSFMGVTASFGLMLCSLSVKKIINE
ncbi:MAG: ThiF family adenylyltransferase [Campylobacterota bacterium]|nr:ThiF family adenylyltransferase [Campylobacterota bacterium]